MTKAAVFKSGVVMILLVMFAGVLLSGCIFDAPKKVVEVDFGSVTKITIKTGAEASETTEYTLTNEQKADFLDNYGILGMEQETGVNNLFGNWVTAYTFTVYYNDKILWLFNRGESFTITVGGYPTNSGNTVWWLKRQNGFKTSRVQIEAADKAKFTAWFDGHFAEGEPSGGIEG
ncbi:MAG: hypothetical protein LBN07_02545 [Christensenellaceae bacterium]|jgi:hypothetical protein|nr:hypothetical protein [Christensenellaceae bacterium]